MWAFQKRHAFILLELSLLSSDCVCYAPTVLKSRCLLSPSTARPPPCWGVAPDQRPKAGGILFVGEGDENTKDEKSPEEISVTGDASTSGNEKMTPSTANTSPETTEGSPKKQDEDVINDFPSKVESFAENVTNMTKSTAKNLGLGGKEVDTKWVDPYMQANTRLDFSWWAW